MSKHMKKEPYTIPVASDDFYKHRMSLYENMLSQYRTENDGLKVENERLKAENEKMRDAILRMVMK